MAISIAEISKVIGSIASYKGAGITFEVKIIDARVVYGRVDYLIAPIAGTGDVWCDSRSLVLSLR